MNAPCPPPLQEAGVPIAPIAPERFGLLNDYQQRFPLCAEPFAAIAAEQGLELATVLACYRDWQAAGLVSRIGPVFAPHRIGASTLAALAVPPEQLEAVAARVSALAQVNHNYEREHHWNLWFVATAPDASQLQALLTRIGAESGCPLLDLPLETPYHIDLGFDLNLEPHQDSKPALRPGAHGEPPCTLDSLDRQLLATLEDGLPLEPRPYARLAEAAGLNEAWLLTRLEEWLATGILKRFGVVVRHHELGYRANAMCVWNVPEARIDELGQQLAAEPGVTLCYRRKRQLPDWPYNLYCMIHGQAREAVHQQRNALVERLGLAAYPQQMLFSGRRFKQCGARYSSPQETRHD